jgi:carbamoylphosphate synthase large subunit
MSALNPDALVWKQLTKIKSVKFFSSTPEIPKSSKRRKLRTVIIPLMESHLYEMPTNFTSLTSTPELVSLMSDKLLLTENLIANGLAQCVPKTWTDPTNLVFPSIIKRRDLNAGKGIRILKSVHELHEALSDLEFHEKHYFFQEFVSGDVEYVCHLVALKGKVLFSNYFMYQLPNLETIRGWQSAIPITKLGVNLNHETSRTIKNVIKHLNYSGPCNIDFKLINGIPKIFEINPRLGGSLMVEENLPVLAKILEIVIKNAT